MKNSILPLPSGYLTSGVHAGLKSRGKLDMALFYSRFPATAVGMVTTNQVKAAPARHTEASLKKGNKIQAIVVNTKNANALTGKQGAKDVAATVRLASKLLDVPAQSVLAHSTGVIGVPLPMPKILAGVRQAALRLSRIGGHEAALGIMTTDTFPKTAARPLWIGGKNAWLTGFAKGSGMIHPNMATMLVYLLTDAAVSRSLLNQALQEAVQTSFHRITVDGDVSTNDSVVLLANGACGNKPLSVKGPDYKTFVQALREVCLELAQAVVRDGEGATKFVSITVQGAKTDKDAYLAAMAVAKSSLVKTALFGADPNWGRVLAAVGYSGAAVDEFKVKATIGGYVLYDGAPRKGWSRARLRAILQKPNVDILVDLKLGKGKTTVYTCDLTDGYIDINGRYTT
ncbi:MAG TPA: bifunctional glutamate N-acetyltransferase/amino-acid acetyltransferase ArgJ [bacterium]|nr:bifunctional glutamate N-acetyltransferase/amino-acid acetyltransferase ArgJ [bacterium]